MSLNDKVHELLLRQIAEGRQIGSQVCAYKDGKIIVDTCAGQMGPDDPRPVQPDTLFCVFSSTKGLAALTVAILADKGKLEYDAPVAKYWPEFARNGKGRLTVAEAVSHQGGLHRMPDPFRLEDITDWDAGIRRMEEGVPAYPPGTATGYHAVTFAWVAGGIVAGATGQHIRDAMNNEVARPLGIEDELYVGIPGGVEDRLATLKVWQINETERTSENLRAMPPEQWDHFNDLEVRRACLPSGNGHFTARAMAKMYAVLAGGGELDGVRLISPEQILRMSTLMTEDVDRVLGLPIPKGVGFFLGGSGPMGPRRSAFGHGGAGGATGFCDPEAGLAVGITVNKMLISPPGESPTEHICNLIREELGVA